MIILVGVDYHNMALEERELFSLSQESLPQIYSEVKTRFTEAVFLSTCNRMEVYFTGSPESPAAMIDWLGERFIPSKVSQEKTAALKAKFYHHRGSGAIRHLFEVAAGLHSMVVGENQILHQIKRSYQEACGLMDLKGDFHKLFQAALGLGKKVRAKTDISKGGMSIGSVSVDIIKKLYERDSQFTIALIGAGEIAEEVLKSLLHHGQVTVWICNRDPERAQKLMNRYHNAFAGKYIPFDQRYRITAEADVTVVSTNAPDYVITKEKLEQALQGRYRFSFLIDLSVPRNIDPSVTELQDLVVYTLDDLDRIIEESYSHRSAQTSACYNLIEEHLREYQEDMTRRRFFLLKEEWEGLLADINRERENNHKEIIPTEKLEIYFKQLYRQFTSGEIGEWPEVLDSGMRSKDFLTRSLESVSLSQRSD